MKSVWNLGPPWFCFDVKFKLFLVNIKIRGTQQKNIGMVKTEDKCWDINIFFVHQLQFASQFRAVWVRIFRVWKIKWILFVVMLWSGYNIEYRHWLTLTWSYQFSSLLEFFSEALSHCSAFSPAQTLSISVSSALMERIPAAFTMACRLTFSIEIEIIPPGEDGWKNVDV